MEIDKSNMVAVITKIATDIATKIVEAKLMEAQFTVPKVPDHHHNGTDSSVLDTDSAKYIFVLPASGNSNATDGVVSPFLLGNQLVGQGNQIVGYGNTSGSNNPANKGIFTSMPIPIIYGHGVGVDSQFNGGIAPQGTIIYFNNPGVDSSLYISFGDGTWGRVKSA